MSGKNPPATIAIRPRGPLDARVRVPGSKSITNRVAVCALLAQGRSRLSGALESDDTRVMRAGIAALGAGVKVRGDEWSIDGTGGALTTPAAPLDVGNSGTTARFLTAVATLAPDPTVIDGNARMRERPISDLVHTLNTLGARIEILGKNGCPPVRTHGGGLEGGNAEIDARRSSQFVSAVLLAAPYARRDIRLTFKAETLVSRPYIELTLEVMRAFGAEAGWQNDNNLYVRAGLPYRGRDYTVEPDASAAAYPFAAAAIAGGRVRVEGFPPASIQADLALLDVLTSMGCRVSRDANGIEVARSPDQPLAPVDVDMNAMPDAVLALAVVALFAEGTSRIRNVANLRIKESDRLLALETELRRLGARATATSDSLEIEPQPLHGATIATYDDHRMAMAFALTGLRVPGVEIKDPQCVTKTWPNYFAMLEQL